MQNESEVGFISRLLYGTSKVVVENIKLGDPYTEIKKVISISILYFNPGLGTDYLYQVLFSVSYKKVMSDLKVKRTLF